MAKCKKCGKYRAQLLSDGRYRCPNCGARYRRHQIWNKSRLSSQAKNRLLEMFVLGVPVYRQRFRSSVSATATERFYRLIRATCALQEGLRQPFSGSLEMDETMFGGRHPGKRGWGAAGMVIVFGILKRNGLVQVSPLEGRGYREITGKVASQTQPGSLYYTDDWHAYASLAMRGEHIVIRKEKGHPKGRDHINGIEGFWSYAKNWLYPYRGVPRKYFHRYLGEVAFRFNHRDEDLVPLLRRLMKSTDADKIDELLVQIR